MTLQIEGHTDSRGDDDFNLDLSQRRAAAVVDFLVWRGVSRDRLVPIGFGETKPIADNESPAGQATNRRVVFRATGADDVKIEYKQTGPSEDTIGW